jgi:uncharacterized protein YbaR (Trm112 family)
MSGNGRSGERSAGPRLDPKLLEVLVCPLTKAVLVYNPETQELLSRKAALAYPIRNGVPLMTAEAARHLTDEEMDKL